MRWGGGVYALLSGSGGCGRDLARNQAKKRGLGLGCRGFVVVGWGLEGGVGLECCFCCSLFILFNFLSTCVRQSVKI